MGILVSAGVQEGSEPVLTEDGCVDPRTEDPESWECDCYESFQAKCTAIKNHSAVRNNYTFGKCLRAILCDLPNMCPSWRAEVLCSDDPEIQVYRNLLTGGQGPLLISDAHGRF